MTVIHIFEGCEPIALLILATQGNLLGIQQQRPRGNPTGKQLLPFILVFELELFPRLTYVQDLKASTYWTPEGTSEDQLRNLPLLYHPLPDDENLNRPDKILPSRTPTNNHLRLSLDIWLGTTGNRARQTLSLREPPEQDLGHDDPLELFGYDENIWGYHP